MRLPLCISCTMEEKALIMWVVEQAMAAVAIHNALGPHGNLGAWDAAGAGGDLHGAG